MGQTLAEVLRGHLPIDDLAAYCSGCDWKPEGSYSDEVFAAHLADVVTAWLGTDAGQEAAEAAVNGPRSDEQGSAGVVGRSDEREGIQ